MSKSEVGIGVFPEFFVGQERTIVECGELTASAFRFSSGVCAVRLKNELGQLVMLPFQGQQVWSAEFNGRNLTMKSMFDEPRLTQNYLETYGAFLLHCGATAMGNPSLRDSHPLHGELPNAPYHKAYVVVGEDQRGPYVGLGGQYQHTVAFGHNYFAEPLVTLHAGSTMLRAEMTISNLMRSAMELMYLAHINFRPVDNGRLVYSALCTPGHVTVRRTVPAHVRTPSGYAEFLEELSQDPGKHNLLVPGLLFDPEVVLIIDYVSDADGWAHAMQVRPDGTADYVRHRPDQLDTGVRWISRTGDQEALGITLPATAEPDGYLAEKAKGNLKIIPSGGRFYCEIEAGMLVPLEVELMEEKIASIVGKQA